MAPTIVADDDALLDEPRLARVEGLAPGALVDVVATLTTWNGRRWRSSARFRAGRGGSIDLARDLALDGIGGGTLALVTCMDRIAGDAPAVSVLTPRTIELAASAEGVRLERSITRRLAREGVTRELLSEGDVVGAAYLPADGARAPGVLVLGGSSGEPDYVTAALLASRGFAAVALAYFRAPGTSAWLDAIPLERFARGAAWLRARTGHPFVAAWGTSRGAEAALAAAAYTGAFSAVVSIAGSGLRHAGITERRDDAWIGAWTFRGRPLAYLEEDNPRVPAMASPSGEPRDETVLHHLPALRHARAVRRAAIPAERIDGPVLFAAGSDDRCWPAARLSAFAAERRRKARRPTVELVFPGAGHFLGPPYLPCTTDRYTHALTRRTYLAGGSTAADAAACDELWPRAIELLRDAASSRERA